MSLDRSCVNQYLQDWLNHINENVENDEIKFKDGLQFYVPYEGLHMPIVSTIFAITDRLSLDPQAKYLAVHLFDKYLSLLYMEYISHSGKDKITDTLIDELYCKISDQVKLIVASCVQIASKVNLLKTGLNIKQTQEILKWMEPLVDCSKQIVSAYERRILKTINFEIPLNLPVCIIELFLIHTELANISGLWNTCLQILDISYMRHIEFFEQFHLLARGTVYDKSKPNCRDFVVFEINAAFLAASVVVCSTFFRCLSRKILESLAVKLGNIIDMSAIDIKVSANILLTLAIGEEDFKKICNAEQGILSSDDDSI